MGRKLQNSFPKNTLYFISLPILSYFFLHKQKVTKLEIEKKNKTRLRGKLGINLQKFSKIVIFIN